MSEPEAEAPKPDESHAETEQGYIKSIDERVKEGIEQGKASIIDELKSLFGGAKKEPEKAERSIKDDMRDALRELRSEERKKEKPEPAPEPKKEPEKPPREHRKITSRMWGDPE